MKGGNLPTKQLSDSNWGTLDHANRVPQLLSGNESTEVQDALRRISHGYTLYSIISLFYVDDHIPFMHIVQYNIIRTFYVDDHLPTLSARR